MGIELSYRRATIPLVVGILLSLLFARLVWGWTNPTQAPPNGNVSLPSAQWTASGTAIYNSNSGNVGIGITNPGQKFSVAGTIESTSGGFKFPDGTVQAKAVKQYIVRKGADESVTNSTVLQNDDELFYPLVSLDTCAFQIDLWFTTPNAADGKFAITVPAGTSRLVWNYVTAVSAGAAVVPPAGISTSGQAVEFGGNGTYAPVTIVGQVINANPGNLQLQWAQNTADVDATTVKADSHMVVTCDA